MRSKGVTILGCLCIIYGIIDLLNLQNLQSLQTKFEFYTKTFGIVSYILDTITSAVLIILGIYLLKLKEWARKSLIILNVFFILQLFLIPLFENKEYQNSIMENLAATSHWSLEEREKSREYIEKLKVLYYGPNFLWFCIIIFFLTRAKVKEQFQSSGGENEKI